MCLSMMRCVRPRSENAALCRCVLRTTNARLILTACPHRQPDDPHAPPTRPARAKRTRRNTRTLLLAPRRPAARGSAARAPNMGRRVPVRPPSPSALHRRVPVRPPLAAVDTRPNLTACAHRPRRAARERAACAPPMRNACAHPTRTGLAPPSRLPTSARVRKSCPPSVPTSLETAAGQAERLLPVGDACRPDVAVGADEVLHGPHRHATFGSARWWPTS